MFLLLVFLYFMNLFQSYAKLPQAKFDPNNFRPIFKSRNFCGDEIQIGQQCGNDVNRKCVMMTFFARCKCVNGFVEDKNNEGKCVCPEQMIENLGKCDCPDGQVKTPQGVCITPVTSCPHGQILGCVQGTGCMDDCPRCIPICNSSR